MSVEADLATIRAALRSFGQDSAELTLISDGRVNEHWTVTLPGEKSLVLRRYVATRSTGAIKYEHAALAYAHSKGWPVAAPLANANGDAIVEVEGERFSLFP
ncbi:MAG: hypothetical protein ABI305_10285, partial [Tepidiformaceae bacterium]